MRHFNWKFVIYRFRFLFLFILFGLASLLTELLIRELLFKTFPFFFGASISFLIGIFLAFFLNISFNFKISKPKRNKALFYFLLISVISFSVQLIIVNSNILNLEYSFSRIISAAVFFWISYFFHTKFSFKDYKKVGVAIYANGIEDLHSIYDKIKNYPDFIHLDIVDKTFNKDAEKVLTYKSEVIRAFWRTKKIEAHIMSRKPQEWVEQIIGNVNKIYIHLDIDDNIENTLKYIKRHNCNAGIVLSSISDLKKMYSLIEMIDSVLILSILKPGFSGQTFNKKALELINEINSIPQRKSIELCVDGGINFDTIKYIQSENVVSGSFVLNSDDSIKKIIQLQTSAQYG